MKFNRIIAASISATLLYSTPSFAQENIAHLEPSSNWQVDYGEESCSLRRTFGSENASVHLEIMQQVPGAYFQVTIASTSYDISGSDALFRFEPDETPLVPHYLRLGATGDLAVLRYTDSLQRNVPDQPAAPIDWTDEERNERERLITALAIDHGFQRDMILQTGEMHAPMEALRACMSDLYGSWGVNLEAHATLSRPVQQKHAEQVLQRLLRMAPPDVFSAPSSLPPVIRLIVGADGRVARCRVHFAPWDEGLSEKVCETVTRHSRYDPALDAAGQPIVSYDALVLQFHAP